MRRRDRGALPGCHSRRAGATGRASPALRGGSGNVRLTFKQGKRNKY